MIELNDNILARILAEGDACAKNGREACGLLVEIDNQLTWWPCENVALGRDEFCIDGEQFADIADKGEVKAIVHTHVNCSPEPSDADRASCAEMGLPWLIVSIPNYEQRWLYPEEYIAPLVGRKFVFGVHDCYSIIRDWYKLTKNIELPNFERKDRFWERGENLYLDNFEAAGFYRLGTDVEPVEGDVFLMQIRTPLPAHGALYVGNTRILHHMQGTLSRHDVYGGTWRYLTTHHLRYKHA